MMTSSSTTHTRQAWILVVGLGVVMAISFVVNIATCVWRIATTREG